MKINYLIAFFIISFAGLVVKATEDRTALPKVTILEVGNESPIAVKDQVLAFYTDLIKRDRAGIVARLFPNVKDKGIFWLGWLSLTSNPNVRYSVTFAPVLGKNDTYRAIVARIDYSGKETYSSWIDYWVNSIEGRSIPVPEHIYNKLLTGGGDEFLITLADFDRYWIQSSSNRSP